LKDKRVFAGEEVILVVELLDLLGFLMVREVEGEPTELLLLTRSP
jgi:hypothetical protein